MIIKHFSNNALSKEHELFIVKCMKDEMLQLAHICKLDYQCEEATAEKNELIETLKKNPALENVDIKLLHRVDAMIFRGWLFEYKGRGYVLCDIGNDNFSFICTAEEALVGVHYHKFQSGY